MNSNDLSNIRQHEKEELHKAKSVGGSCAKCSASYQMPVGDLWCKMKRKYVKTYNVCYLFEERE